MQTMQVSRNLIVLEYDTILHSGHKKPFNKPCIDLKPKIKYSITKLKLSYNMYHIYLVSNAWHVRSSLKEIIQDYSILWRHHKTTNKNLESLTVLPTVYATYSLK